MFPYRITKATQKENVIIITYNQFLFKLNKDTMNILKEKMIENMNDLIGYKQSAIVNSPVDEEGQVQMVCFFSKYVKNVGHEKIKVKEIDQVHLLKIE